MQFNYFTREFLFLFSKNYEFAEDRAIHIAIIKMIFFIGKSSIKYVIFLFILNIFFIYFLINGTFESFNRFYKIKMDGQNLFIKTLFTS